MKLFLTFLLVWLVSARAFTPEDIPLQLVNDSPAARIESAQLTVEYERQVFSYSQVVQNTSTRHILNISLELKTATMVDGHVVNSSVHVEKIETRLAPNVTSRFCVAQDAAMPAFLQDVTAGTISVVRVEFADGTVWERAKN